MSDLNNFREALRRDPYDPQLKSMKDNIHLKLKGIYGRIFKRIELPIQRPISIVLEHEPASSHGKTSQNQDFHHQCQQGFDLNQTTRQDQHAPLSLNHYLPSFDPEPNYTSSSITPVYQTYHHPNSGYADHHASLTHEYPHVNSDFFGHQMNQDYAHLQPRLDHIQLNPHTSLVAEGNEQDPNQLNSFVRSLFH